MDGYAGSRILGQVLALMACGFARGKTMVVGAGCCAFGMRVTAREYSSSIGNGLLALTRIHCHSDTHLPAIFPFPVISFERCSYQPTTERCLSFFSSRNELKQASTLATPKSRFTLNQRIQVCVYAEKLVYFVPSVTSKSDLTAVSEQPGWARVSRLVPQISPDTRTCLFLEHQHPPIVLPVS